MKKKVLVSGCNGAMGRIICSLISKTDDLEVSCGFDMVDDLSGPFPIYSTYFSLLEMEDVPDIIIDFSAPEACKTVSDYAFAKKIPIVVATTGIYAPTEIHLKEDISKEVPVFMSANMSIQVNLVKQVLKMLCMGIPTAEVEITETHHNRKKDAPSGTAKVFANAVKETFEEIHGTTYDIIYGRDVKRKENEIGVCAKRGANIVGTHTIEFFSPFETLEITHTAHSRDLFAEGAIAAARFLLDKEPGLYGMDDLV